MEGLRPQGRRGATLLGSLLAVLGAIDPAAGGKPADPTELARGVREVRERKYAEAVTTLEDVVRRLSQQKAVRAQVVKANAYLGVAHLGLGHAESAAAYFGVALDLDRHLRLDPADVPPEAITTLESLKRERAKLPEPAKRTVSAPRKKGGFGKTALIGGGVAAAAAGVLVASKGGSESTKPGLVISSFVFAPANAVCVESGALFNIPVVMFVEITAGSEAVGISGGSVTLVGFADRAEVTNPTVGVAPTRLEAGERRVLRLETRFTCRNLPDDLPRTEQWRGRLRIGAPGFPTAETQNVLQIEYP